MGRGGAKCMAKFGGHSMEFIEASYIQVDVTFIVIGRMVSGLSVGFAHVK